MFEKQCRLARAAKYFKGGGGGSGGGSIDIPSFRQTLGQAVSGFPSVSRTYRDFTANEPLLQMQNPLLARLAGYGMGAANQFQNVPGQLLDRANQFRDQFQGLPNQLLQGANSLRDQFGGLAANMLGSANSLRTQFQGVPGDLLRSADRLQSQFGGLPQQYLNIMRGQQPIAQTGNLTQDQTNQAVQAARAAAQARGDIYSNNASFAEALNRRQYADARQQQAIGNVESLGQSALGAGTTLQNTIMGLRQGAEGAGIGLRNAVMGLQQGAQGSGTGLQNAIMGLDQGAQGLALGREQGAAGLQQAGMGMSQGIEQLLGYPSEQLTKGELGQVGAFQTLFGPTENLAGDWLKAQAGANTAGAGQDASNKNATTGTIASIIGGIATAY
jgi:hypothetical protein